MKALTHEEIDDMFGTDGIVCGANDPNCDCVPVKKALHPVLGELLKAGASPEQIAFQLIGKAVAILAAWKYTRDDGKVDGGGLMKEIAENVSAAILHRFMPDVGRSPLAGQDPQISH